MQLQINLEPKRHARENNAESEEFYNENYTKFSNQCKTVFKALLRGERLTTLNALVKYGIGDLRRRKKDLIDLWGIPVLSERKKGGFKEIYLSENYIKNYKAKNESAAN